MNVLDLLKQDHQMVGQLIDEVQKAEPGDEKVKELAQQIVQQLTVHAALEESLFYPALGERAENEEERVDLYEAFTEHDVAKHLMSLLNGRRKDDALFKAELQVLGENVKHHVREEESTIFKLARQLLDEEELEQLGETVQAEKERLMRSPRAMSGRKKSTSARKKATSGRKKKTQTGGRGRKSSAKKSSTRKTGRRKSR